MKLVIIAGGRGSRLNFKNIPKPMVTINHKPILEYQIKLAQKYGIKDIYLLTGYKAQKITNYFKDGNQSNIKITCLTETKPLGTAGCLRLLTKIIDKKERFLVFSGDIMLDIELTSLIKSDDFIKPYATLVIHPNDHPEDSDLVEINTKNRIVAYHPKPHLKKYYQNLGVASICILPGKILSDVPKNRSSDLWKEIFPKLLKNNKNIYGYKTTEYIKDIGTPKRLESVRKDYKTGRIARLNKLNKRKAIFLDRDGVINKYVPNLNNINKFKLIKGVSEAINKINKSEYLAIITTNQPAIAKGYLQEQRLSEIHKKMETLLGKSSAYIDGLYYCPHHPEKGFRGEVTSLKIKCHCRKPKIGMFNKAAEDFNIDLNKSWTIGDNEVDLIAGKKAGCKTIYLNRNIKQNQFADFVYKNLKQAIKLILD